MTSKQRWTLIAAILGSGIVFLDSTVVNVADYEASLDEILHLLRPDTIALAAEIARLPEGIRGYGPIKEHSSATARRRQNELMQAIKAGG